MHESYWGFRERPFQNTPDPRFLYYSPAHEEALVRLLYTISEGKGLAVLTGDVGTGKTLLCRVFRRELADRGYGVAYLVNPDLSPEDLLRAILVELDAAAPAGASKGDLWRALHDHVGARDGAGREAVVILDEAQAISDPRTLEEIRLLLNLVREDRFLVPVVLVGQPELTPRVQRFPALRQRVGVSCHLRPLTRDETADYVAHRIEVAGGPPDLFDPGTVDLLHAASRGTPREVNTIADLALLVGCGEGASRITAEVMQRAVGEMAAAGAAGKA